MKEEYFIPQYCQSYQRIYPFQEYGDNDNFFIQLVYYIDSVRFVSRIGEPLTNKVAMNNELIFNHLDMIDFTKYHLLNEKREATDLVGVEKVTEIYGYAPKKAYYTYTSEPIQLFGVEDNSTNASANITNAYQDSFTSDITFDITEGAENFNVGDIVVIKRDYIAITGDSGITTYLHDITTGEVAIKAKSNNSITIPNVVLKYVNTGAEFSSNVKQIINIGGQAFPYSQSVYPYCYIYKNASTKLPTTKVVPIRNVITYTETIPEIESRLVISSGINEVDTITADTSPSLNEWKEKIALGEYYNIQDSYFETLYPLTMYKNILKQTKAR